MNLERRRFLKLTSLASSGLYLAQALPHSTAATPASPSSFATVPNTSPNYAQWQEYARGLLKPIQRLFVPGRASLDINGPGSACGEAADRFETFARPLLLAAHYLQSRPETGPEAEEAKQLRNSLAKWFRAGLVIGSSPTGPESWGPDANYHQLHVEMGLLAIALQIASVDLWDPLTQAEKDQVAYWFSSARNTGYVDNNHYFMGIHVIEFLGSVGYGLPTDDLIVTEYFERLEFMHRGNGWFQDGINQSFDYYNAYAFNYYGLWWARLHGEKNPERAQRWREWARTFTQDYQHFFAASGEHAAFGRSITYRFNAIATFGMSVLENCTDLPMGRLRRICGRNLEFFLNKPIYQDQGCLAIGWVDQFEDSRELYTGAGSPYWAAKGFAALLIPPEHEFWHADEVPLESEIADHARVIRPAGIVVRSVDGQVEIINAGSQVSHTNLRYGAWKWSKAAYRSGIGFTYAFPEPTRWSPDSALTIDMPDGRNYGRHSTVALEMAQDHVLYSWALGFAWPPEGPPVQTNVSLNTGIWWNKGWVLHVHSYDARQPVKFQQGGYALPLATTNSDRTEQPQHLAAWDTVAGQGTVIQSLLGFDGTAWDSRHDESKRRTHLYSPFHITPITNTKSRVGTGYLAALTWVGEDRAASKPWQVVSTTAGTWKLKHPKLGNWIINHALLPRGA